MTMNPIPDSSILRRSPHEASSPPGSEEPNRPAGSSPEYMEKAPSSISLRSISRSSDIMHTCSFSDHDALAAISTPLPDGDDNDGDNNDAPSTLSSFEVHARTGRKQLQAGEPGKAMQSYETALRQKHASLHLESNHVKIIIANVLYDIGWIHSNNNKNWEPAKSVYAFELSRDLFSSCYGPHSYSVAIVLCRLGELYSALCEPEASINALSEALAILLTKKSTKEQLADTWLTLGQQFQLTGQQEEAQDCFAEAKQLCQTDI